MCYASGAINHGNCGFSFLDGGVLHCGPSMEERYLRLGIQNTWITFYAKIVGEPKEPVTVCLHWPDYDAGQNISTDDWERKILPFGRAVNSLIYISTDEITWSRVNVVVSNRNEHTFQVLLSDNGFAFLSVGLPYTVTMFEQLVKDAALCENVQVETIGTDYCGAPIHVFTQTNSSIDLKRKKTIWYQAVQHPHEPLGAFVGEGMIRYLMSEEAKPLLDRYIFHLIPVFSVWHWMHSRQKHVTGINPNRDWVNQQLPEVRLVANYIDEAMARGERFVMSFDVHTGISETSDTSQCVSSISISQARPEEERFANQLIQMSNYFQPGAVYDWGKTEPMLFEEYIRRMGVQSHILELCRYNWYDRASGQVSFPRREVYLDLGRDFVRAIDASLECI